MGINVPLNLAHASMLQHPISTDCNSDGIPKESRDHFEETPNPKTPRQEKYLQRYPQSHYPLPPPLAMHPFRVSLHEIFLHLPYPRLHSLCATSIFLFFENRHRNRYRQSYAKTVQRYNHNFSYCQNLSDIDSLRQTSAPIKLKETTLLRFNLPNSAIYPFTRTMFLFMFISIYKC